MSEAFYIDTEFDGHGGPLLSMALIREAGGSLYLCLADEPRELTPWVAENVWPLVHIRLPVGKTYAYLRDWGHFIRGFIGNCQHPVIVADSPVDIARFCEVISTGPDGGWQSADYPAMTFEVHNVDCYPTTLPGAVQHNAWWDAMALREKLRTTPTLARQAPGASHSAPADAGGGVEEAAAMIEERVGAHVGQPISVDFAFGLALAMQEVFALPATNQQHPQSNDKEG